MSFSAETITFDGISSEQFGLMLVAKLDSNQQEDTAIGPKLSIVEETVARRNKRIHFGSKIEEPLSFKLVLAVSGTENSQDRYDQSMIIGWLYGHQDYKYLSIDQTDMIDFQYKCKITEIKPISVGSNIVGFVIDVRCDSPYAYSLPTVERIDCSGSTSYTYLNKSNLNDYYYPVIKIVPHTSNLSMINHSDHDRTFTLEGVTANTNITIDCQNEIITSSDGRNLYAHCNLVFPRFLRGRNQLEIHGVCSVTIHSEFPMLIGS